MKYAMIKKYKNLLIFYRHAWIGSALLVAGIISHWVYEFNYVIIGLYIAGFGLILSSIIVSYTINQYPEEFEEEKKKLDKLKDDNLIK